MQCVHSRKNNREEILLSFPFSLDVQYCLDTIEECRDHQNQY
jgi:hypothetical protein